MKPIFAPTMQPWSPLRAYVARRFTPANLRFYCLVFLTVNIALMAIRFGTTSNGQSGFGYPLGRDYTAFYIAGKIANERSFLSAYDLELQTKQFHELLPKEPAESQLPYVNPPFTLLLFSPLSHLPYGWAFAVWLVLSFALYTAGVWLLLRTATRLPQYARTTALPLALAFTPFLVYCWGLGQLSSIGVFCLGLAIYLERNNRLVLSGLALSLCLYKPTLLILVIPMLVLTGRFRALAGLITGSLALALTSALLVGWHGLQTYVTVLSTFQRWKATASTISQTSLYVDVRTAFKLFIDAHPASQIVVFAVYVGGLLLLVWAWWRIGRRPLAWALTITWSLVLNVYTPLYDVTLLVIPAVLVADHLYSIENDSLPESFKVFLTLLFVVPMSYVFLANTGGFQIFTVLILAFGVYELRLLTRTKASMNEPRLEPI